MMSNGKIAVYVDGKYRQARLDENGLLTFDRVLALGRISDDYTLRITYQNDKRESFELLRGQHVKPWAGMRFRIVSSP